MGIREYLTESSLSRIYQHIESEDSVFVIISAYKGNDASEDKKNHVQLHNDIRGMGFGLVEFESQWSHSDGRKVKEESFFVPNMTKRDGLKLAKKYDQEAIIMKDSSGLKEIQQDGSVSLNFNSASQKKNFTLANKELFSKLKKGSHKGKGFTFTVTEYKNHNMAAAYGIVLGGREQEKFVIYEETT